VTLRIEGVSKTYPGGIRALRGVSLDVPAGMFGLLGPNGAGKTTLMRAVATLGEPDEGGITFDGIDVLKGKDEIRRRLGYLPQDFGVPPRVTALELLDHLAVLKGFTHGPRRKEMVERLLQVTNLWDVRKRKLGSFSGGMRQRFGIAQALIGDPRLVVVDEPTAGLDPEERARFLGLLSEIGDEVVVVLSTHIVEDVSEVCRRMAILVDGEVRSQGEPAALVESLRGRVFSRAVTRTELEGLSHDHRVLGTRWQGGRLVAHVLSEGAAVPGFEPVEADLRDLYFHTLAASSALSPPA
jgi:ABC-type multidrug transport system ATPase subunit